MFRTSSQGLLTCGSLVEKSCICLFVLYMLGTNMIQEEANRLLARIADKIPVYFVAGQARHNDVFKGFQKNTYGMALYVLI